MSLVSIGQQNRRKLCLATVGLSAAVALVCLLGGCRPVTRYYLPPTGSLPAAVLGEWVAFSDRDGTYYLLTLHEDGCGFLRVMPPRTTVVASNMVRWRLSGPTLTFTLPLAASRAEIVRAECLVLPEQLRGQFEGGGGPEAVVFKRYSDHLSRLGILRGDTGDLPAAPAHRGGQP